MGGGESSGMPSRAFRGWIAASLVLLVAQSIAHVALAMGADRPETALDVQHSNGVPDLVSSGVLALAALGALAVARHARGPDAIASLVAAFLLAVLVVADLLHDGAHPSSAGGVLVVGLVVATGISAGLVGLRGSRRCRINLAVAALMLGASFVASGIDRFELFEGRRGDAVKELRLVTKEGLELLGWSLVALALWDEALRRRERHGAPRRRATTSGPRADSQAEPLPR